MEDMPGKVQKANTHILRCQNHKHAHSSRSVQGSVQWGDGTFTWVRFAAKLTPCHRTHIAKVSIPVGRWNVTHGFDSRESSPPATQTYGDSQHTSGAMDESSGKGSKMQAHISSGVVMDIAAFKVSHSVGVDQDATALQAKKWSA